MRALGWLVAAFGAFWALMGLVNLGLGAGASGLGVMVSAVLFVLPGLAVTALGALLLKKN